MDLMIPPSKETVEKIRKMAGVDEQRIKEAVKMLTEWLHLQPHLPHQYEEARMERLFLRCKKSIEKCKETLDVYFTVKTALPEIFSNRDPLLPWFQETSKVSCFIPLPKLTEKYDRVLIMAIFEHDPEKYLAINVMKMCTLVVEIGYMEDYQLSNIVFIDANNFAMSNLMQYTLPFLKKLEFVLTKVYTTRVKEIHLVNVPPLIDSTIQLFKGLLKTKLANKIHAHRKGSNTLSEFVSPEILPTEYGGTGGSIPELWDAWKKKVESHRSWFLEQEHLKVDESKRPAKALNSNELFGFEGSFRQLTVD